MERVYKEKDWKGILKRRKGRVNIKRRMGRGCKEKGEEGI